MKKSLYLILAFSAALLMASWSFSGQRLFDSPTATATGTERQVQPTAAEQKEEIKVDNAGETTASMPAETKWRPIYEKDGSISNAEHSLRIIGESITPSEPPVILTTVFFEDFETPASWNMANPPSGWSIIDSGYIYDSYDWGRYASTTWGVAAARVSGAISTTTNNDWMISPSVDFTGTTACTLKMRYYYDDIAPTGKDSAQVLLSDNNGASWGSIVVTYTDVDSGTLTAPKLATFDISAFAANKPNIKVAFRYVKDTLYTAGSFGFDNFELRADGNQLFYETMDTTGWGAINSGKGWAGPTAGWSIIDNIDAVNNNDWAQYAAGTNWGNVARIYYSPAEWQTEWLISPTVSITPAADQVLLKLKQYYYDGAGEDTAWIYGSTDGGTTWSQLIAMYNSTQGSSTNPSRPSFDITSWANGQTNVKFAFKYVGYNDWYWWIDSIYVETVDLPDHDVATTAIKSPLFGVVGYSAPVKSQVANVGTNTETFQDTFKIVYLNKNVLFYEDFSNPQLWTGANPPINALGTWSIIDSGSVPGTWNNNDWHAYYHSSWGDTIARVYYSPVEYQNEWLITPGINCATASNVRLTMNIFYDDWTSDLTDSGWVLGTTDDWTTTHIIALYTGADFGSISTPAKPVYDITSWAAGESNVKIAFKYKGYNALYCMYLDKVQVYEELTPTTVYSNGQTVTNLTSLETRDVTFSNWYISSAGDYRLTTFTALGTDQNMANDTVTTNISTLNHISSGGPDAGYYSWNDNLGSGPAYNWRDISGIGTPITFPGTGDDRFTRIGIGFSFFFYGNLFDRISVSENGFASFDSLTSGYLSNSTLPNTALPNNTLALLWDDLQQGPDASIYYYTNNVDTFIISYLNFKWYATADSANRFDAQLIITGDNKIKYQYRSVGPNIPTGHTIGIENAGGTIGLQYFYNGAPSGNLALPGLAITFSYNPPSHDMAATAIVGPGTGEVNGTPFTPRTVFVNQGGVTETSVPVYFRIYNSSGVLVYSSNKTIASIAPTAVDSVNFDPCTLFVNGTYSCTSYVSLGTDTYPANDKVAKSFIVDQHYGTGGPDAGYYRWIDNTVVGGPTYSWVDTTDGGWTRIATWPIGTTDDGRTNPIYMGFPSGFYFYGTMQDSIVISTNGWLSFMAQASNYLTNYAPPSASGPAKGVFVNWDDLDGETTADTGDVYYKYDAANNRFIVSWYDWSYYSTPYNPGDFQVIFDADDSSITMQYGPATGPRQTDITVGIQDSTRTIGLNYFTDNSPQLNLPYTGLAIKFYPYVPAHDVKVVSINAPTAIAQGQTYDIIATFKNTGANTETFNVRASDNRGYSNIQTITALAPGATVVDTFPGWAINFACSSYVLTVVTQLGTDVDPTNDTLQATYQSQPASNYGIVYDDGIIVNAWRYYSPSNLIANAFNVPYANATISAITYQFTNLDNYPTWPDANRDTVRLYIYFDTNYDGFPDEPPVYSVKRVPPDHGPLVWNVACDTTIDVSCNIFWAAWNFIDTLKPEGICLDAATDYPLAKWVREGGVWQPYGGTIVGDNVIRAYVNANLGQSTDIQVASTSLSGSANVGGADTASTTMDNVGACNLLYSASVVQYSPRPIHGDIPIALNSSPIGSQVDPKTGSTEPVYPPVINAQGGPDAFGYRWRDSDEPSGPAYSWVDISTIGTPVTFTNGTLDDGWTNLFPMGMTFNFYGIPYDSIVISTNGWISFVSQTSSYLTNASIPSTALPNTIIPVYWDDMDARNDGDCYYYYDSANNRFIVSWVTWPHYADTTNKIDFQVILNGDGSIKMQYGGGLFDRTSYTVGIENETGTIGLQVAYNQTYLHNSMAILFNRPPQWLTTNLTSGMLAPSDPPLTVNAYMDASQLPAGTYTGAILITSNDPDEPVTTINVSFTVTGGGGECDYVLGDINGDGNRIGGDVTYGVRYFKGVGAVPPDSCYMDSTGTWLYVAGDVNGNCEFRGSDITRLVAFFKGNASLSYCHFFPPPILLAPSPINIQQGLNIVPRDENKAIIRESKSAE